MRSIGYCYKDFVTIQSNVRPLRYGDRRYFIPASELPASVCSDLGLIGRFCLHLGGRTQPQLEVLHDSNQSLLPQCIDGGSIGWTNKFYMYTEGLIRGYHFQDPAHCRYDHFKSTCWSVGLKGVWSDIKVHVSECFGLLLCDVCSALVVYLLRDARTRPATTQL